MKRIFIQTFTMAIIATAVQLSFDTQVAMAWIWTALPIAGSVLSSALGGAASAHAGSKAQREIDKQERREKAWYERAWNQRYADTEAGQNLIRKALDLVKRQVKRAEGAARVAGSTEAATARAKEQANNTIGNAVANIAANDTANKTRVDLTHRQAMNGITQQRINTALNTANQINTAASQASNNLMRAGTAMLGSDDDSFWDGLTRKNKNDES